MYTLRLASRKCLRPWTCSELLAVTRNFSTPVPEKTEKEIKEEEEKEAAILKKFTEDKDKTVTPWFVDSIVERPPDLPDNVAELTALDPMPQEQIVRKVRIGRFEKTPMQSSYGKTKDWYITWESPTPWRNPLMGWKSTADPLKDLEIRFETFDQALAYAKKRGLEYEIKDRPDMELRLGQKSYAYNRLSSDLTSRLRKDPPAQTKVEWDHSNGSGASHYFRPSRYHGDGQVRQHGHSPEDPIA